MALEVTPTTPGVYIDEENVLPEPHNEGLHEVPMEDPEVIPIPHVGEPVENGSAVVLESTLFDEHRLTSDATESSEEEE